MRKGGRPHLVPVLSVMVDEALHFCASERSRKARNLATDPQCVIGGSSAVLDLVMEGEALRVDDSLRGSSIRRLAGPDC